MSWSPSTGLRNGWRKFDGKRRERVLVKIVGERVTGHTDCVVL